MNKKAITMIFLIAIVIGLVFASMTDYNISSMLFGEQLIQKTETHTAALSVGPGDGIHSNLPHVLCAKWQANQYNILYWDAWAGESHNAALTFTHYPGTDGYVRYTTTCTPCEAQCNCNLANLSYCVNSAPIETQISVTVYYTEEEPCVKPSKPVVTVHEKTTTTVTIKWQLGPETNIQNYRVYKQGAAFYTLSKDKTQFTFENLQPNTTYPLGVAKINDCGLQSDTTTISVKTLTNEQEETETNCTDGVDNDLDGDIDCDDSDCAGNPACSVLPQEEDNCTDGIDNDGDSLIDCDDIDCAGNPACTSPPPTDGLLKGAVKDEKGNAIQGALIQTTQGNTTSNALGAYQIELPAGGYEVRVSKTDYRTVSQVIDIVAGHTTVQDFVLSSDVTKGSISGTVRNSDSTIQHTYITLEGAKVTFYGVTLEGAEVKADEYKATTDGNGNFLIIDIPPGTYDVVASKEGYKSLTLSDLVVKKGETTFAYFNLIPEATVGEISGIVYNGITSSPMSGALVEVSGPEGASRGTNPSGEFTIGNLQPGTYTVTISKAGFETVTTSVVLTAGKLIHINVYLVPEGSSEPGAVDSQDVDPQEDSGWSPIPISFISMTERIREFIIEHKVMLLLLLLLIILLILLLWYWSLPKKRKPRNSRPLSKSTRKPPTKNKRSTKRKRKKTKKPRDEYKIEIRRG